MSDYIASTELGIHAHDRYKTIHYEDICASPIKIMENLNECLASCGYKPRESRFIPNKFDIQNKISLPDELINKILAYIDILKKSHN
jgi:hypothetical protein